MFFCLFFCCCFKLGRGAEGGILFYYHYWYLWSRRCRGRVRNSTRLLLFVFLYSGGSGSLAAFLRFLMRLLLLIFHLSIEALLSLVLLLLSRKKSKIFSSILLPLLFQLYQCFLYLFRRKNFHLVPPQIPLSSSFSLGICPMHKGIPLLHTLLLLYIQCLCIIAQHRLDGRQMNKQRFHGHDVLFFCELSSLCSSLNSVISKCN